MQPTDLFNAPVPGQSLTRSKENKMPMEMPPKLNTLEEALDHMFGVIMSKKFGKHLATLVVKDKKAHMDRIASQMVQSGIIGGLYSVDVGMLLVEPVLIMLIFAAAQLDATVSFSTDSGYEDRTGFDYLTDAVLQQDPDTTVQLGIPDGEMAEAQGEQGEAELPKDTKPTPPTSPLLGG